ncbi:hypothetical protein A8B82_03800 [Sulfitobacter sp. EhC04]|uniref:hypothetical protein n=1 Tax=Sulfitobacter sp. EhC04 TaxID=1849168 RepID=UPI0007F3F691|nr:hypothetical protein [Sulfitobacter sp. EhC04]OAN71431.1 hypothetical protein A8B82_03800 [Sulfitobacter sp. EhC04]
MTPRAVAVPQNAFLSRHVGQGANYTDCYEVAVSGRVDLAQFITRFYTTWLFRLERLVLSVGLRRRIADTEVAALAAGAQGFAIWRVEAREEGQILLCDLRGGTCSWLAVAPGEAGDTRLLFGSAVMAPPGRELPRIVRILTPFHKRYARSLLRAAARKLRKG